MHASKNNNTTSDNVTACEQTEQKLEMVESVIQEVAERKYAERFSRQVQTLGFSLLVVVLFIHLLTTFAAVLQQLLIALFLLYLILPIRRYLKHKYHLSRLISYMIIAGGVIVITWIVTLMVQSSLAHFNGNWPKYKQTLAVAVEQVSEWVPAAHPDNLKEVIMGPVNPANQRPEQVRSALETFVYVIEQVTIVLIFLAFLVAETGLFSERIRRSFPPPRGEQILEILNRINSSISKYISVKTFVSLLMGVLTTVALLLMGVDYAVFWGVLAFLLNYIPYVGSIIAMVPPSILAVLQYENPGYGLLVFLVLNIIHNVLGYWLEPVMAGDRLDLSPFIVIFSLAFWGAVWGVVGMILAVPLMVSVKIVLENIPGTRPFAGLLANVSSEEPPATHPVRPAESELQPKIESNNRQMAGKS